jgi:hypothetical protein
MLVVKELQVLLRVQLVVTTVVEMAVMTPRIQLTQKAALVVVDQIFARVHQVIHIQIV